MKIYSTQISAYVFLLCIHLWLHEMSRKVDIKLGILCWETKVQMCRSQLSFPAKHLQNALCDWVAHDQLSYQVLWYKIHPLHLHKGVTCGCLLIGVALLYLSLRAYVPEANFFSPSKYYLDSNIEISTLFSKLFVIFFFLMRSHCSLVLNQYACLLHPCCR